MVTRASLVGAMAVALAAALLVPPALMGTVAQADTGYGPCCPLAHSGQQPAAGATAGSAYWHPRPMLPGLKPVAVVHQGQTTEVRAFEVAGNLFVPARMFTLVGATVEWLGNDKSSIALGGKTVQLTLGEETVQVLEGGQTTAATWALCPRLRNGMTYVPLRAAADALGVAVDWQNGAVQLGGNGPAACASPGTTEAAGTSCPASSVEAALGITVVRGRAESPFGTGVGVVQVTADGRGAKMGLQPKDVILACNDKATGCPKDLEKIVADSQAQKLCVCSLVVARGGEKVTLKGSPGEK